MGPAGPHVGSALPHPTPSVRYVINRHSFNFIAPLHRHSDQSFQPSGNLSLRLHADDAVNLSTSAKHQQRRNALYAEASRGDWILIHVELRNRKRPASSTANSWIVGAMIRQGWHQGAHISRITGNGDCSTSVEKVASVTLMGRLRAGSGVLHCPHTGRSPCSNFSWGTRLVAPQALHRINCGGDLMFFGLASQASSKSV